MTSYYSKGYLDNWHVSKVVANLPSPFVKFDEEPDGDSPATVRPTILELCPNFVQKWGPVPAKMGPPKF